MTTTEPIPPLSTLAAIITTKVDDDDDDGSSHNLIRGKWMLDGCRTLDDVVERLGKEIQYIQQLKDDGWELSTTIDDDYGFIERLTRLPN